MSKVIFKTNYSKSGKSIGKGYVRYIAQRDGVDKSINTKFGDINTRYIATRPGVVKLGEHGLFGQEDDINLDKVIHDVKEHLGIVWRPVISMRREDADRLGYNNPYQWRTLLRSMQLEFAKAYRIPIDDLVWYAAFHDEGEHPHIHMIIYNKNPGGEFITDVGWENFKEKLTKNIFKDELKQLYDQRQSLRNELIEEVMLRAELDELDYGECDNEFIKLYNELKFSLEGYTGNRKYKYLSYEQKKKVDAVAKSICKDESIQYLYNQWCQIQTAILGIYKTKQTDVFGEIYENKAFENRIKNAIIKTACRDRNKIQTETEQIKEQTVNRIYGDILFSLCQMIDKSINQTIDECHGKSIVDSKERIKEAKHKRALGIKMEGW